MDIPTSEWLSTTIRDDALLAILQLPSKTGNTFKLPGRASLGFPMSDSNPTVEHPEIDTQLGRALGNMSHHQFNFQQTITYSFYISGTRIQLLEHLAKALHNHIDEHRLSDGGEPELLEANFPSLQEQSRHWLLNAEQHHAFLFMGAALLQHVHTTNQLMREMLLVMGFICWRKNIKMDRIITVLIINQSPRL